MIYQLLPVLYFKINISGIIAAAMTKISTPRTIKNKLNLVKPPDVVHVQHHAKPHLLFLLDRLSSSGESNRTGFLL